jgi:hypothetical protein
VPVAYYVFDVLHLDGMSLLGAPYEQRRNVLVELGLTGEHTKTPAHLTGVDGRTVLDAAELRGLEGVVSKRLTSTYPGRPPLHRLDQSPLLSGGQLVPCAGTAGQGPSAWNVLCATDVPDPVVRPRRCGSRVGAIDLDEVAEIDVGAGEEVFHRRQVEAVDDVVGVQEAVGTHAVELDHLDPPPPVGSGQRPF